MMLSLRNSIIILCLISASLPAYQEPKDYFHSAAQTYVLLGDAKQAKEIIAEGLRKFPNDPSLNNLQNKIKEDEEKKDQQDQKNNQDQNNDKGDQDKKDQQDQDKQKQDQDTQKQDQQQNQDSQDKKDQQRPQPQPGNKQEQLKKEEAERLIRQFSDDANNLNKPVKMYKAIEKKPEKDW